MHVILLCKSFNQAIAMLIKPLRQVIGNADVKNGIVPICQHVNIVHIWSHLSASRVPRSLGFARDDAKNEAYSYMVNIAQNCEYSKNFFISACIFHKVWYDISTQQQRVLKGDEFMAKKQFKAESKRLLDLMINSIYTHQEIFLREIISNASDAMDKLAYTALTDDKIAIDRDQLSITITRDEENRTLTVTDNGIGMTKEEMEQNLGTIAKSGSLGFKQAMEKQEDIDIIGQFGVGFYAAFMVASKVTVISKKYGEETAYKWVSDGADGYTITETQKDTYGTHVIMELKADTEDDRYSRFLEEYEIRSLVKKYSDYIRYPIRMEVSKSRKKEDSDEYESYTEMDTLNSMVPLWQRAKKDVTEEEYTAFYREKFFDYNKPLRTIHWSAEGTVSFKAMLFIPGKAPFDFYSRDYKPGLQLYSAGVLIMENCEDLLPEHFRFVRGVVDSLDLSLNISREMLQHDRQLKIIAKGIEKKIKAELKSMLENEREKYEEFYAAFSRSIKYGTVAEYGAHKDATQDLLLLFSHKENKLVTLQEYADAMADGQEKIYYICLLLHSKCLARKLTQMRKVFSLAVAVVAHGVMSGSKKGQLCDIRVCFLACPYAPYM